MCGEEPAASAKVRVPLEIPPRVRGRGRICCTLIFKAGNTPACAGKRSEFVLLEVGVWKYPRVCGEELSGKEYALGLMEIPPRVRGRVDDVSCGVLIPGNTPACAGKRKTILSRIKSRWKYPRVCGEEISVKTLSGSISEIPPRVRGRVACAGSDVIAAGNTPACAGKSFFYLESRFTPRKYPRVCGEETNETLYFQRSRILDSPRPGRMDTTVRPSKSNTFREFFPAVSIENPCSCRGSL